MLDEYVSERLSEFGPSTTVILISWVRSSWVLIRHPDSIWLNWAFKAYVPILKYVPEKVLPYPSPNCPFKTLFDSVAEPIHEKLSNSFAGRISNWTFTESSHK